MEKGRERDREGAEGERGGVREWEGEGKDRETYTCMGREAI
jgi:hypothetical protein